MPSAGGRRRGNSSAPQPEPEQPGPNNAPLVLVTEHGRHSSESRRIVRAQAARASAAQSRVTRARNREEREASARTSTQSPTEIPAPSIVSPAPQLSALATIGEADSGLATWLRQLLQTGPVVLADPLSANPIASLQPTTLQANDPRPHLPIAVPRGFSILRHRIRISDTLILLLSRASCFDFLSPGAESRLRGLLCDLVFGQTQLTTPPPYSPGHPIQSFIRIACIALTIYQYQRMTQGPEHPLGTYHGGLSAALADALLLDLAALAEPTAAEVSLWALMIISVTTPTPSPHFLAMLRRLLDDLGCSSWDQTREVLVEFIYPSYYLDGLCRDLFFQLRRPETGAVG